MKNKFEKDDIIRFDEENKDLPNHDYIGLIILLHLRYVWLVFRKKKRYRRNKNMFSWRDKYKDIKINLSRVVL